MANVKQIDVNFSTSTTTEGLGNGKPTSFYGDKKRDISWDDATWILTSSFIIFTMQSGFGLLESGMVSTKNEVNIMVKNCVDVLFGGLTFWMLGFGLAFGDGPYNNAFCGVGYFFLDADESEMGVVFSWFIFQLSFATTSTTVVSGAMAERTNLLAYIIFCTFNTLVYCFPAHWIWDDKGFLHQLGVVDIAGAGAVHLVGGISALVATLILKPRTGRFERKRPPVMGCPTNSLVGMFMLWWGWLGFNCGSTFGISDGKWKLAARSAVATVCSSMAGGMVGICWSWIFNKRKFLVPDLINGILGSLVAVTGICAIAHPWESLIIGLIGGLFAVSTPILLNKLKIDDPVGIFPVHGVCAIWGMLSIGLFAEKDEIQNLTYGRKGLFRGGGPYLLGVQTVAVVIIIVWSALCSYCLLKVIDLTIGLRVSLEDELLGADWVEHGIKSDFAIDEILSSSSSPRPSQRVFHRRQSLGLRRHVSPMADIEAYLGTGSNAHSGNDHVTDFENGSSARRRVSFGAITFVEAAVTKSDSSDCSVSTGVVNRAFDDASLSDSGVSSDEEKNGSSYTAKRRRRSKRT